MEAKTMPVAAGTLSWAAANASSDAISSFLLALARQKWLNGLSLQPMCAQTRWIFNLPPILALQSGLVALARAVAAVVYGDDATLWPLLELLDWTLEYTGMTIRETGDWKSPLGVSRLGCLDTPYLRIQV